MAFYNGYDPILPYLSNDDAIPSDIAPILLENSISWVW